MKEDCTSLTVLSGIEEDDVTSTVQAVITAAADVPTEILVAAAWLIVWAVIELTADDTTVLVIFPAVPATILHILQRLCGISALAETYDIIFPNPENMSMP